MTETAPPATRPRGLPRVASRVLDVARPSDSLVLLRLERPPGFRFEAGQWTYVFLPGAEDKRAYSIASAPSDDALELCVKVVPGGPASHFMYDLQPGHALELSGPLGSYRFVTPPGQTSVLLGTGTGVAPLRSMLRERLARREAGPVWLFLGSGVPANLPYHDEFTALARENADFHYVPVLSKAPMTWTGERGWIQEAFLKHFYRRNDVHAYVCGLKRMVEDVRGLLQGQGVPDAQIHLERYD